MFIYHCISDVNSSGDYMFGYMLGVIGIYGTSVALYPCYSPFILGSNGVLVSGERLFVALKVIPL